MYFLSMLFFFLPVLFISIPFFVVLFVSSTLFFFFPFFLISLPALFILLPLLVFLILLFKGMRILLFRILPVVVIALTLLLFVTLFDCPFCESEKDASLTEGLSVQDTHSYLREAD